MTGFLHLLAEMGPTAKPAVPVILQTMTGWGIDRSRTVRSVLEKIDPEAVSVRPGSFSLRASPATAANGAVIPGLLMRLTDPDPRVRATAQSAWENIKWDSDAELVFRAAVTSYLNSNNRLARQEAAFAAWRQRPSDSMVDLLVKEFQTSPDLETGTRLMKHFEQMVDAVNPHILTISNVVFTTPQLRFLSNEALNLPVSRRVDGQSAQ